MRVIPVLDLKGGCVVHAVAGRREKYQPIRSVLVDSAVPLEVAAAFRHVLGLQELYVADLDAIGGSEPACGTLEALVNLGCQLMVDAGVQDQERAERLVESGVSRVVLALESLPDPAVLDRLLCAIGQDRLVFSLDLRAGEPLGPRVAWGFASGLEIAERVVCSGVRQMIVLDLAHVGTGSGPGTVPLCCQILDRHPTVELICGGGVRDVADLHRLGTTPIAGVLVATALHQGRITRADLEELLR